ncbi:MAG TPA: hypothetical protein VGC79_29265 [Polyangiaceae bacterium]
MAQRAGLLVRRGGELAFLPASVARWLVPLPRLTKIPWDSAQMALVAGDVVAVLALGEPSGELLLCELDGQAVALSGLSADRVGFWPASESGVIVDGVTVPALDLSDALKQFRGDRPATQEGAL